MMTQINYAASNPSVFEEIDLEVLHMIAFEYDLHEISIESKLSIPEIQKIISKLYKHLHVASKPGLVRAAFEKRPSLTMVII